MEYENYFASHFHLDSSINFKLFNSDCYYERYLDKDCVYFETNILFSLNKADFVRKLQVKIMTGSYPELFIKGEHSIGLGLNHTIKLYYKDLLLHDYHGLIELSSVYSNELRKNIQHSISPFNHSEARYKELHITPEFTVEYVNEYHEKHATIFKMMDI